MDFRGQQIPQHERKRSHMEETKFGAFEEAILDTQSPQLASRMKLQRSSLENAGSTYTPTNGSWAGFHFSRNDSELDPTSVNAAFAQQHGQQHFGNSPVSPNRVFAQQAPWSASEDSGSCTPTPVLEQPIEYTTDGPHVFGQAQSHSAQVPDYENLHLSTMQSFQPSVPFPASPQSSKGGWISAASSDSLDYRPMPAHADSQTPPFGANVHLVRRDGIRKKNARFEIPAERNLRTIDQLINQTNDEQEIKELKQQKRLLRNRQAALDSRQRKKQHTERLEEEKKHYTAVINELEDALGDLKLQEAEWARTKDSWAASQQQYQHYIDSLVMEKEELVRCHTIESGELRKKNAVLMEQLHRMESTAMSTAPSSTGFSADFSDFDHLTMNSWDDFSIGNDFSIESEPRQGSALITSVKHEQRPGSTQEDDKALTSGFLLMLLLCGAWVASRSATSSLDLLPAIPEDMRAASATVLENLYQDSGVQLQGFAGSSVSQTFASAPKASGNARSQKTTLSAYEIAGLTQSPLETLHHRLITPSEQQLRQQAFSLTPAQYNEISSDGAFHSSAGYTSLRNGKLVDALAAVRSTSEATAAETYTSSLLKERVPTQILKDFARMVSDCNNKLHESPGFGKFK